LKLRLTQIIAFTPGASKVTAKGTKLN